MLSRWLGGESDKWRKVTGIYPYKIFDPGDHGNAYTPKDYVFQPKTSKNGAIKEVCEYAQMLFDVKWRELGGEIVPHAYLVHEDDIDDAYWGLDLPDLVVFSHPDPYIKDVITATEKVDEKYNRITVRSSAPDGTQYAFTKETDDLISGDELPVEYLESVSDLPQDADHGAWVEERANLLFEYYSVHAYTYTMTLIDRTDLELYQRLIFIGFDVIPSTTMRITALLTPM